MCDVCWKEFRGWCKSFTKTEILLVILEVILLILCICFLIFLILHLMVCSKERELEQPYSDRISSSATDPTLHPHVPTFNPTTTFKCTVPKDLKGEAKCTWKPSQKTVATRQYFVDGWTRVPPTPPTHTTPRPTSAASEASVASALAGVDRLAFDDQSDGEEAGDDVRRSLLALARAAPPTDLTFGCPLSVIASRWALTAASCIETIEEVDSLDEFAMMERDGPRLGRAHTVADVVLHPRAGAGDRAHDLAALRSETELGGDRALALPTPLDRHALTPGERLHVLGFGAFRDRAASGAAGAARAVAVYSLGGAWCAGGGWAPRHLVPAGARRTGTCGAGPLCAGVRYSRGTPCHYCAGSPLLRGRTLLGVMAGGTDCAAHCEPALYVDVAAARDWLDGVLDDDPD